MSDRPEQMLRLPEVIQRTGLARTTIYRLMNEGTFPAKQKLATRAVGWGRSAIDHWIATRAHG